MADERITADRDLDARVDLERTEKLLRIVAHSVVQVAGRR